MTKSQMQQRLIAAFPGATVEVLDTTGTEDHWDVSIISDHFRGLSRVKAHQAVMAVFSSELKTGEVHALAINARPKSE